MCDKRLRPPQDLSAHDRMQWRGLPCPIPRSDRSLSKPRALSAEPEPSRPRATESSDDDANGAQLLRQPQLIDHSDDDEGCAFQCHRCHRRCANRTQLSGGGAASSRPKAEAQATLRTPTTLHCPHVRRSVRQGSRGKHTIVRHADAVPIPPVAIWLARSDVQTPGLRPIVDRYLRVSCDRYLRVSVLGRGRDFAIARSFRGVLGVLSVVFH